VVAVMTGPHCVGHSVPAWMVACRCDHVRVKPICGHIAVHTSNTIRCMSDKTHEQALKNHAQYIEERKGLVDAARESARTFDQAVLAFGSAVFAASVAFLKDVAPTPLPFTLKWLGTSWFLFATGLLFALLSFLFSHKTCMFEIEQQTRELTAGYIRPSNKWSTLTTLCNYFSLALLFFGTLSWCVFGFENLAGRKVVAAPNQRECKSVGSNVQAQSPK
jgi:hypothetical protein